MRLDLELVRRRIYESRQEAKECITNGFVVVNGSVVYKKTKHVTEEDTILTTNRRKFVGRGGDKLEGIILRIHPEATSHLFTGKVALDIGSSTGGFTDCLVSHGVEHVDAVDVGTSQLHHSLRDNPKVSLYENTDIRNYRAACTYDIIVADVSFIALDAIIDVVLSFGSTSTEYFLLIKPQFEVGAGNTKKGIVKDQRMIDSIIEKYKSLLTSKGMSQVIVAPCVLKGGDGNQEYFLYCK